MRGRGVFGGLSIPPTSRATVRDRVAPSSPSGAVNHIPNIASYRKVLCELGEYRVVHLFNLLKGWPTSGIKIPALQNRRPCIIGEKRRLL
jgi:hypothetical protein